MSALEELQAANAQLLADITAHGAMLDPLQLLKLRIDHLTDWLIDTPVDQPVNDREAFEEEWERTLNGVLQGVKVEVSKPKLMVPGPDGGLQVQPHLPLDGKS